jgi:hypothetical protein
LTDVEEFEISAPFHDGFDARSSDAHAATYAKIAELEKVQGDAAERGVGDGGAAEGEIEVCEGGQAQG